MIPDLSRPRRVHVVGAGGAGMGAIATVRPGVLVALGGGASGAFVRVEVGGRVGYARRDAVGVVD